MKNITLLFAFVLVLSFISPFRADAQWYKPYGVTNSNELTETQCREAMGKASDMVNGGGILTAIGGVGAVLGGFLISIPLTPTGNGTFQEELDASLRNLLRKIFGTVFLIGGGAIAAIGTPIWITGAVRKSGIKKVLARFPVKVSLSPGVIHDCNHYSLGLSMTIRF
jgi:hypothetical protein